MNDDIIIKDKPLAVLTFLRIFHFLHIGTKACKTCFNLFLLNGINKYNLIIQIGYIVFNYQQNTIIAYMK